MQVRSTSKFDVRLTSGFSGHAGLSAIYLTTLPTEKPSLSAKGTTASREHLQDLLVTAAQDIYGSRADLFPIWNSIIQGHNLVHCAPACLNVIYFASKA